jgi:RNA polymerase sigma-70 factor (ECF subfamily)
MRVHASFSSRADASTSTFGADAAKDEGAHSVASTTLSAGVAANGTATPERLMDEFLDGDPQAFERLFKQLAPRIASALAQMSGDARLAEDLTQVVFLKLYRARAAYQRGMLVTPWVFAIARNAFLDERRHRRRRPETLSPDGSLPEQVSEPRYELDEGAQQALRAMVQSLPPAQQEALLLLKVQGLSLAEVAALSGTSVASIKMRVHRAYRSLRERLDRLPPRVAAQPVRASIPERGRTRQ